VEEEGTVSLDVLFDECGMETSKKGQVFKHRKTGKEIVLQDTPLIIETKEDESKFAVLFYPLDRVDTRFRTVMTVADFKEVYEKVEGHIVLVEFGDLNG